MQETDQTIETQRENNTRPKLEIQPSRFGLESTIGFKGLNVGTLNVKTQTRKLRVGILLGWHRTVWKTCLSKWSRKRVPKNKRREDEEGMKRRTEREQKRKNKYSKERRRERE